MQQVEPVEGESLRLNLQMTISPDNLLARES